MSGELYIVATPIGNMEDITDRAVRVLTVSDLILAEDTRVSGRMLKRIGVDTRMESYHKFSEKKGVEKYLDMVRGGRRVSLISDAGTPAVSDPGRYLVNAALKEGLKVTPIPGPSAATAAFSVAGCESSRFLFEGFLPSKGAERESRLKKCILMGVPFLLYESPNRINNLLKLLEGENVRVVVCRELTKQFEEVFLYRGEAVKEKGEFTVVVEPLVSERVKIPEDVVDRELISLLIDREMTVRDTVFILKQTYPELNSNELKRFVLSLKK
jgi:16S rRNA (cytidine1402-2'-O)-methyltransferase